MDKNSKIYIAGHTGLVGSALLRALEVKGFKNLVSRARKELDLTDQEAVRKFFAKESPEYVFLAAARVGGIMANSTHPAEFIYENLMIQTNVIDAAYRNGVKKLLFLSSACVYPRACAQPMKEEYLLTGPFEPTNEPYSIAKVAGMNMCRSYNRQYGANFISVIPINLYGLNDNLDPAASHVIPGIMRKFHEAKARHAPQVSMWGTGSAVREFMTSDDCADACLYLMEHFNPTKEENERGEMYINIGSGEGVTIKELAQMVKDVVGYAGEVVWDSAKPDGMPKKLLDTSKLKKLGWQSNVGLDEGLKVMYQWFTTQV